MATFLKPKVATAINQKRSWQYYSLENVFPNFTFLSCFSVIFFSVFTSLVFKVGLFRFVFPGLDTAFFVFHSIIPLLSWRMKKGPITRVEPPCECQGWEEFPPLGRKSGGDLREIGNHGGLRLALLLCFHFPRSWTALEASKNRPMLK